MTRSVPHLQCRAIGQTMQVGGTHFVLRLYAGCLRGGGLLQLVGHTGVGKVHERVFEQIGQ